jgi:hypothetical protein
MTRYSFAYGTLSAIDLTVATTELALELGWHVVDDLHNSDHYPIITSVDTSKTFLSLRKRWQMETANWETGKLQKADKTQIARRKPQH